MNRCTPPPPLPARQRARLTALALGLAVAGTACLLAPTTPAHAQHQPMGTATVARAFPEHALFGTLEIRSATNARINGKAIAIAPGMRLFNQQNSMLRYQDLTRQKLRVRYVTETSTGMLLNAWILRESEIPPRRLFGLFGPATQDPHEVQTGPLGVGKTKQAGSARNTVAPAAAATSIAGHSTIQGLQGH